MSNYIVIEGLIGVGKTSLCRILRDELGARLVLEPAEDNPFLAAFYADQARFAFPAQMFYLATRYAQQADLLQVVRGTQSRFFETGVNVIRAVVVVQSQTGAVMVGQAFALKQQLIGAHAWREGHGPSPDPAVQLSVEFLDR